MSDDRLIIVSGALSIFGGGIGYFHIIEILGIDLVYVSLDCFSKTP